MNISQYPKDIPYYPNELPPCWPFCPRPSAPLGPRSDGSPMEPLVAADPEVWSGEATMGGVPHNTSKLVGGLVAINFLFSH